MHLDKTKLLPLIEKTKTLNTKSQYNFAVPSKSNVSKHTAEDQLRTLLSGLSGWLNKHPNLVNGSTYGRKLAELKSRLPDKKTYHYGSGLSDSDTEAIRSELLTLLKAIDRENKSIFIVHGRDHDMREKVQSALRGLGLATVVLDREDDLGQTVIEKFIKESARCEYAVVLCSADDEGRLRTKARSSKDAPSPRPRARQNVVLELGYFLAKVGRENLFVLHPEESIEQPSDFLGVIYEKYDKAGQWKDKLVRALRGSGFKIPQKLAERI
ncbi:TIR domain-containing protein [Spirosoma aerolatum]|uniref:TIR domain-containing protein n=1 Tax=Spirosoma aerolatum TaxID=1211326 RepID=UPI0009AEC989|nr:nucleotide-binding protein [Spirosoma aerolatum]